MKLLILSVLFCGALAGQYGYGGHGHGRRGHGYGLFQKVVSHYGNTKFAYNDGRSTRQEHIAYDGSRYGSYSVRDADGSLRTVRYKAGKDGFQIVGDDGSVKEDNVARAAALAEKAAELAELAPQAPEVPDVPDVPEVPEVPEVDLPVAPTNPPDYGKRNEEVYANRRKYYGHRNRGYAGYGHAGYAGYGHGGYGGYGYTKAYTHKTVVRPAGYGYGGYGRVGYGYGGYGYGKCYNHEKGVLEDCKEEKKDEKNVYGTGYGYGHARRGYGYGHARRGYGYGGYGYGKCYNHEKGVLEDCKEVKKSEKTVYGAGYGYGGYGRRGLGYGGYGKKGYGYGRCYNHELGVWEACKDKKDGYGYGGYGYTAPAASYGYGVARPAYKW